MRLLTKGLLIAWLIVALAYLPAARAQTSAPDTDQSSRLTDYLHAHRLPLVGAQVLSSSTGRSVMLYGYTATEFGKGDAEAKARRFLQDSDVVISNHIRVRPEIASMRSPRSSSSSSQSAYPPSADTGAQAPPPAEAPPPDVAAYQNQQQDSQQQQYVNQQAQQYMNQGNSASSLTSALIPLLGMGLGIGLGGGGSGFGMGVSPGFGSFGGNPFGGSQYGSPYGGSPYGYPSGPSPYGGPSNPYP